MWRYLKMVHMWSNLKFLHMTDVEEWEISFIIKNNVHNLWCFVAFYTVLLQNNFCWQFTLFCREIILSQYTRLCVEKNFSQKLYQWRKNDKYQVWAWDEWKLFIENILRKKRMLLHIYADKYAEKNWGRCFFILLT